MHLKRVALLTICIVLAGSNNLVHTIYAQHEPIVLTLAVENFMKDALFSSNAGELLKPFEDAHPGVTVKIVAPDAPSKSLIYNSPDMYFDDWQRYATSADVLFVRTFQITPEVVHGGYLLDLKSLTDTDKSLNADDFYPAVFKSFQFDGGVWALPVSTGWVSMLNYDPQAFDAVGLNYPNDHWTFDDLINAAHKLTQRDASGKVARNGIDIGSGGDSLLVDLLGDYIFDQTTNPNLPQLTRADVISFLNKWLVFQREGIVGPQRAQDTGILTYNAPLNVNIAYDSNSESSKLISALLPGGKAGVAPEGYAVSGGTHYSELAYALAQFLTTQLSDVYGPSTLPARRSVGHLAQASLGSLYKADQHAFIENAIEHAIPQSDLRYFPEFWASLYKVSGGQSPDAATALYEAQENSLKNLQLVVVRRQTTILSVVAPDLPPLAAGQRAIRFNVGKFYTDTLNRPAWNQVIQDFIAHDSTVKRIDFSNSDNSDLNTLTSKEDCFYLPTSAVLRAQNGQLLNIDPFIDDDKNFNRATIPRGVLTQLQYNNKLWAYPLTFSPSLLSYDANQFTQAGLVMPTNGWDFNAFHDTLNALKTASVSPIFSPGASSGSALLALMAADGSLPLDFRTDPPTVDFTSPAVTAGIRQVLDLAKQGFIDYHELGQFAQRQPPSKALIYADTLVASRLFKPDNGKLKITNYPRSGDVSVMVYDIGAGYVSAGATNPEDCYRWIVTLAQHPELFSGLPIQTAALTNPLLNAAPDAVAIIKAYLLQLEKSNTIIIPLPESTSYADMILEMILYKSFDDYVLNNKNLDVGLAQAEQKAKGFLACSSNADSHLGSSYNEKLSDCSKVLGS